MSLYDDAELQDQLRSAFQKGGEQVQHAHIGILVHHPPVEPPPAALPALPTPNAQVDRVQIPEREQREKKKR